MLCVYIYICVYKKNIYIYIYTYILLYVCAVWAYMQGTIEIDN